MNLAFCVWFSFFCLLLPTSWAVDPPEAAELDTILAKRLPADGPGVVVLVARDGKLLFSRGYGLADREDKVPVTPETRFRIGSVTKQFTAAAILRLAQEKKLSLDDRLAHYFAGYPNGDKITLRELLTHTSGVHNYTEHPDFMARVTRPIAPADLIAFFRNDPLDFIPGEEFRYSNSGYFLLGQIVQEVSGLALGDYLQQQFFGPLGLHDTGTWHSANPPEHAARGYSFEDGKLQAAVDWDMSWAGGAGELYSDAGDLWHWTEALQEGRLLPAAGLAEMDSEVAVPKKESLILRYGMGLYHSDIWGLPTIGHNGGLDGYLSEVMWFPDQKATIVVLGNAFPAPPDDVPAGIVPVVARAFLQADMATPPPLDSTVDPKTYADYVGRYDYRAGIQEVTVADGHIFAQLTGQAKCEIFPAGHDAFFYKVVEATMVFQRDKAGAVTAIKHSQNGTSFIAPKLAPKDALVLPADALEPYVGQYQYGPTAVLTVTRRGNQLYAQLTGQAEYPIFATSDHEFEWKIVAARVDFVRGADGKVTGAVHHQNGTSFTAPKLPPPSK